MGLAASREQRTMSRQVFVVFLALAMGAAACGGSPRRSTTQSKIVDIVDDHGLDPADFYLFATMFWLQPAGNGDLELTPGVPSFLDQHGALIDRKDPRWMVVSLDGSPTRTTLPSAANTLVGLLRRR